MGRAPRTSARDRRTRRPAGFARFFTKQLLLFVALALLIVVIDFFLYAVIAYRESNSNFNDGTPVRQRVERFGDGSHGVLRPATRHRVDGVQDPEVDCEYQQHVQREVAHGRRGVGERHRPELVLRETHDQQAVVPIPEKRRIVGDGRIMRCHRHVVHAEPVGHVLRLVLRPGHRAVRPDDERPGVLLAERLQAVLPKRP